MYWACDLDLRHFNPQTTSLLWYPNQVILLFLSTKFKHFRIIRFSYAADKQTDRQTYRRPRTSYPRRPTARVGVDNNWSTTDCVILRLRVSHPGHTYSPLVLSFNINFIYIYARVGRNEPASCRQAARDREWLSYPQRGIFHWNTTLAI